MLSLLKGAAIIGAIFVLSPVRTEVAAPPGPAPTASASPALAALPPALEAAGADLAGAERAWRSLPDGTRGRLLKLLAEDGEARAGHR